MLNCWACEQRFQLSHIERDGVLRSRSAEQGGPYQIYRCPHCHRQSRIETSLKRRLFASPDKEFSALDYLFGWFELLSPRDFLQVVSWQQKNLERRRLFFEHDGDDRYSGSSVFGTLKHWLGSGNEDPEPQAQEDKRARDRAGRQKRTSPEESEPKIPHPYQILGLDTDASEAEIRTAFRILVRRHHPDKLGSTDPERVAEANRRLDELVRAYESLTGG